LIRIGSAQILVATLADIIKSKKAAGRPQDLAVLPVLEKLLEKTADHQERETRGTKEGE
jgi:hypothetical protein